MRYAQIQTSRKMMPTANGRVIHPIIITGRENKGVTANNPTTDRNRTKRKIRPGQCPKTSLMGSSSAYWVIYR